MQREPGFDPNFLNSRTSNVWVPNVVISVAKMTICKFLRTKTDGWIFLSKYQNHWKQCGAYDASDTSFILPLSGTLHREGCYSGGFTLAVTYTYKQNNNKEKCRNVFKHIQPFYTWWAKKVGLSGCIAGCNFVNYGPIYRNYTFRKLTKFPERCILLVNC